MQDQVLVGLPVEAQLGAEGGYFCCLLDADAAGFILDWCDEVQDMELPYGARLTLDLWVDEGTLQRFGKSMAGVYVLPDGVREAIKASGNGLISDPEVIEAFRSSSRDSFVPGVARLEIDHEGGLQFTAEVVYENQVESDRYVVVRADLDHDMLWDIEHQQEKKGNSPGM